LSGYERMALELVADATKSIPPGKWRITLQVAFQMRALVRTTGRSSTKALNCIAPQLFAQWRAHRHAYSDICWFLDSSRSAMWIEAAGMEYDALVSELRRRDCLPPRDTLFKLAA